MVALDPTVCLGVNVNNTPQWRPKGNELRLVRGACLIEMHYRGVSPAGSKAAAIVHNLTATAQTHKEGQPFETLKNNNDNAEKHSIVKYF